MGFACRNVRLAGRREGRWRSWNGRGLKGQPPSPGQLGVRASRRSPGPRSSAWSRRRALRTRTVILGVRGCVPDLPYRGWSQKHPGRLHGAPVGGRVPVSVAGQDPQDLREQGLPSEQFDLVETVLTPGRPGLARAIKPGRERRGLGEDMLWLQDEGRKGTPAGIGLDCVLYAQVCPIYHVWDVNRRAFLRSATRTRRILAISGFRHCYEHRSSSSRAC